MGEAHENVLEILKYAQKDYQVNSHGFTAPDLYRYVRDYIDISKPTVRACLEAGVNRGYLDKTEVSQTDFYIIDEAMLAQPSESDMYSEAEQFW
jgi:hypothetical protein